MMVFKKSIPRRSFLRGAGVALSLPLLDAMIPAFAASAQTPLRLGFVYCPNGMRMEQWKPVRQGRDYEMTPTLQPLAAFRNDFLVLGGLNQDIAYARPGEGDNAPHERAGAAFLTGVHPTRGDELGISVDQIAAAELGRETQLTSLELGLHNTDVVGQCEKGWHCGVMNTLSWRTANTALPCENNPRAVFERMFGDAATTEPAARRARIQKNQSLLDSVSEAATRLNLDVGPSDRVKLSEYLDAVRDIERRIQVAEDQTDRVPTIERPSGIPETFAEHAKLMFDLEVLAFQSDLTRVITFMMGREQSDRSFRELGIAETHHQVTHHRDIPELQAKIAQIDHYHAQMFAYLMQKLQSTSDGDGSLLDHSLIVYGSGISEGDRHSYIDLPILLAGGRAAGIEGGNHIRYPEGTQMTDLYATLLDKLGVPGETVANSTKRLDFTSNA